MPFLCVMISVMIVMRYQEILLDCTQSNVLLASVVLVSHWLMLVDFGSVWGKTAILLGLTFTAPDIRAAPFTKN